MSDFNLPTNACQILSFQIHDLKMKIVVNRNFIKEAFEVLADRDFPIENKIEIIEAIEHLVRVHKIELVKLADLEKEQLKLIKKYTQHGL